jgi:hypothetical protein
MNKKLISTISASIVALAIVTAVSIGNFVTDDSESQYNPGLVPPAESIRNIIGGERVANVDAAKAFVGYDVKMPTYLPKDYNVQLINVDRNIQMVSILASKKPVTDETNNIDFTWKDVGIWITLQKADPSFDKEGYISRLVSEFSHQPVKVNGQNGAVHEILTQIQDGETIHAPAEIIFYKGDVSVYIRALLPVDELVKIAESL